MINCSNNVVFLIDLLHIEIIVYWTSSNKTQIVVRVHRCFPFFHLFYFFPCSALHSECCVFCCISRALTSSVQYVCFPCLCSNKPLLGNNADKWTDTFQSAVCCKSISTRLAVCKFCCITTRSSNVPYCHCSCKYFGESLQWIHTSPCR